MDELTLTIMQICSMLLMHLVANPLELMSHPDALLRVTGQLGHISADPYNTNHKG